MNVWEAARIALHGLRSNRLRSVLTMLGIIIGVAAVILLVAFGNGLQTYINEAFGPLANQLTISKTQGSLSGSGEPKDLTDGDVEALSNSVKAPDILSVTPIVNGVANVQASGATTRASVVGTTADYFAVTDRELVVGEYFDEQQVRNKAKVAVLGPNVVADLFGGDAGAALGKQVRVGRTSFRVIGVVTPNGQQDDVVFMPLGTARAYLLGGGDEVNQIIVRATSTNEVDAAEAQINAILDDRHRIREPEARDFNVLKLQTLLDQSSQVLSFVTLFTAAVAGISLVVGSIGVANIMLVTVTERTREIGIRKAIGARRRAILQQFLIESMMLSGIGGIIGILLGIGLSAAAGVVLPALVQDFPAPVVSPGSVILSFSISLIIGLIAGGYPANRAARLRPIEALRYQ
ncbi:putative ABC transport system permease protein [Pseudonocardia thermophila]|uniref:Putative ABC transport system permease protein n=1 Tax=Pseudonocardia thermophila TaxID=1848 RepID=A0A1M6R255_PSETH|nr:ABC transporter permease [Pseudonocardia thermophila]SHK26438.1 putative ABC transport system permease protein [Pseudonocardia thermophila]